MRLRRLGALDLDLAAHLHRLSFEPMGERGWTRQDMAELLAAPGVVGLLAEHDAGFALCRVAADEAELLTIAVDPAARRHGIGAALLAAVVAQARGAGAATLLLEVGVDNPAARALYDRAGFIEVGRRPGYYRRRDGVPADAAILRLGLC